MIGRVSRLFLHPVKSMAAVEVDAAFALAEGFREDRRWMVVDADGTFVSQREAPALARITTSRLGESLSLSVDGTTVTADGGDLGAAREVRIWDDIVLAREAKGDASAFLSSFIGRPSFLVRLSGSRRIDPRFAGDDETVSFADGFPYLVVSEASVKELEERVGHEVDVRRFRPNIVVADVLPFTEDAFERLTIGGVPFRLVKPCARCVMVNVEPRDGTTTPEVLKALATFRKHDHEVFFAMNAIAEREGLVRVGEAATFSEPRTGPY